MELFTASKPFVTQIGASRSVGHPKFVLASSFYQSLTESKICLGFLEPTVLILGASQGGLTVAARVHQLKVSTLIIDTNPRVGDNWRNRYVFL